MKRFCVLELALLIQILVIMAPGAARAQGTVVRWSTLDAGFAVLTSPQAVVTSAIGQSFTGLSTSANEWINSGFLADSLLLGTVTSVRPPDATGIPGQYELLQNYPNPFNPTTTIRFSIVDRQQTTLKIYDILGREVATLVDDVKQPGTYSVQWDATGMASGVYFYRLTTNNFSETRKLMLLR